MGQTGRQDPHDLDVDGDVRARSRSTGWAHGSGPAQRATCPARHIDGARNRLLFDENVARSVERGGDGVISVLFVDLDDFKVVNDSIGHQAGDDLLIAVAERLKSCVRSEDLVARLSGDEFAVLLESAVDQAQAVAVVRRLQDKMRMPVVVGGREVLISASVGLVVEPELWSIVLRPSFRRRTWRCTEQRARARVGSRSSTTRCTRSSSKSSTSRATSL